MENFAVTTLNLSGDDVKGQLLPNRVLLSPGVWNGKIFTAEEIEKAYYNTDWNNYSVYSLIADHSDNDDDHLPLSVHDWIGYVENPRMDDGKLIGDLRVYDKNISSKLIDAEAKFGVSAKLQGSRDGNDTVRDFSFKNFSVVVNPACKDAFINLSDENETLDKIKEKLTNDKFSDKEISVLKNAIGKAQDLDEKDNEKKKEIFNKLQNGNKNNYSENVELKGREAIREEKGMSVEEFYAAPRDPPSSSDLPIYDADHVRNAMARFNQTEFKSEEEKRKAKRKIIQKAKEFNIDVENFKDVGPELSDSSKPELSSDDTEQVKGGLDKKEYKMTEEEKKKEEKSEETSSEESKEQPEKQELSEKEILSKAYEIIGAKLGEDSESQEEEEEKSESEKLSETISELSKKIENIEKKLSESSEDEKSEESEESSEEKETDKKETDEKSEEETSENSEKESTEEKKDTEKLNHKEEKEEKSDKEYFSLNGKEITSGTQEMAKLLGKKYFKR